MVKQKVLKYMNGYTNNAILNSGNGNILLKNIDGDFTNDYTIDLTTHNTPIRINREINRVILDNDTKNIRLAIESQVEPTFKEIQFNTSTFDLVKSNFKSAYIVSTEKGKNYNVTWFYIIDDDISIKTYDLILSKTKVEHKVELAKFDRIVFLESLNKNVNDLYNEIQHNKDDIKGLKKFIKKLV